MDGVITAYTAGGEVNRMTLDRNQVEWQRTCELLQRWLPEPPARIVDIGGGPGRYAMWLNTLQYDCVLFDVVPLHVEHATAHGVRAQLADARDLPSHDAAADAALLMGPLYHLPAPHDRARALREAWRVIKPGGVLVAAALSRWARPLVRAAADQLADPGWHEHTMTTMRTGRASGDAWDDIAFLHCPTSLAQELTDAGFEDVVVAGVEGPVGPWARRDPSLNRHAVDIARQSEFVMAAASIHMLARGVKPR